MNTVDILNRDNFQKNAINSVCIDSSVIKKIFIILDVLILRTIQDNLKKKNPADLVDVI